MSFNKYLFYENAVQSPARHAEFLDFVYTDLRGKPARVLREDFCGTYAISCSWAKRSASHRAIAVDLDPEPLAYGKRTHWASLDPGQRRRVRAYRRDVRARPPAGEPRPDLIAACNFSFYIFKTRPELLRYFKAARQALARDGVFLLEMAGGPGMIEPLHEKSRVSRPETGRFTYIWDQQRFDPITHDARYAIHFEIISKSGRKRVVRDAFTYDWRLWTVPEVRELLAEAGFKGSAVYWETEHEGEGTGEYLRADSAEHAHAWIAYVVGIR